MWPNVDDLDGPGRIVYTPPDTLAVRQVVLINPFERAGEEFRFAGNGLFGSLLQMRVDELARLLAAGRLQFLQSFTSLLAETNRIGRIRHRPTLLNRPWLKGWSG